MSAKRKIACTTPPSLKRRSLLKTTTNVLIGSIALTIILSASIAAAGPFCSTSQFLLSAAIVGQSAATDNTADNKSQQTVDLLRRARQAMAENDLTTADSLISRAEGLGVQYNWLYQGDTPRKARHDLEKRVVAAAASPTKPSQLLSPLGLNKDKPSPTTDPLAAASVQQVTPLPAVDSSNPIRPSVAQGASPMQPSDQAYPNTQPTDNAARMAAAAGQKPIASAPAATLAGNSLLRAARRALAVGDVRHATDLVQQEKALRSNYQPLDDTPDKADAVIRKYQDLSSLDKTTEAYRRAYARNLMEQADGLLRWNEVDEAERLVSRAAAMPLTYGPFEQKPQDLLQRIAVARRPDAGRAAAAASAPGMATASSPSTPAVASRQKATEMVRQAREAIAAGQFDRAEMLAHQAEQLRLPESAYAPGEDRPALVLMDLKQLRQRDTSVMPAGGQYVTTAGGNGQPDLSATRAVYDQAADRTRNVQASGQQPANYPDQRPALEFAQNQPPMTGVPTPAPAPNGMAAEVSSPGMALFEQGETALRAHDGARAYELFRQAAAYTNEMDPMTAQRLQDHLQMLSGPSRTKPQQGAPGSALADETAGRQQALIRQVAAELAHAESNARALRERDPKAALAQLEEARKKVEASSLDSASRDQMFRSVDRAIGETKQLIERNRPQIESAERNDRVRQEVEREQRMKLEVQDKLAMLIDECNRFMDEQEFEKAEVVAKRAAELDPENPVVTQLVWKTKFAHRVMDNQIVQDQKEQGVIDALYGVDKSSIPFSDKNPLVYPDAKDWSKLSKNRAKLMADRRHRRSEREVDIQKKLETPVSLQFTKAPLSKVMDHLANLVGVNIHLDPQGLTEEGITSDTPIDINLRNDIMLKSALTLILEPLHLSYVIKDEVLKITSEQMRDSQVYTLTYNVADLVMPIPNFVPTPMGLASAYHDAMGSVGFGGSMPFGSSTASPLAVVASHDGKAGNTSLNPNVLAQISAGNRPGTIPGVKGSSIGPGPGGLGGGSQADFDSLIELIKTTVRPTSWDDTGGAGSISPFDTNLSLVVSQTQEVHEELADLLEQLRRLQDLQVTIEVRFITLNDNFFERVGVSFDFDIQDNIDGKGVAFGAVTGTGTTAPGNMATGQAFSRNVNSDLIHNQTVTVGMSAPNVFNANLDVPFTQNSFGLAVPQFGGFDAAAGASLGFAILSDVEAYFFINASQGDKRTNVVQAPKVTLFNGQQAMVSDTSQSPFVMSVIPVVGDFAAAQQPVIVVLSEGTFMTVQAVVSADRRFVRLTVVPFFSRISAVNTFTFTGSQTTTTDTTRSGLQAAATDPAKLFNTTGNNTSNTSSGTTVQLPTFSYVTVTTTVSVPDGGTILLGGIKRLSEGRNEFGVPMLDKVPYLNRLFKNVGIGREAQSLMMMVTPRIIIQEEEEEKLGITTP
jgi:general secretion pathway protein D